MRQFTCLLLLCCLSLNGLAEPTDDLRVEFFALYEKDQYDKALPVGLRWLTACEKQYGSEDVNTADAAMGLGMLQYMRKDHPEAVRHLDHATRVYQKTIPIEDQRLAITTYYLGLNYYKTKQFDKALPWLELTLPGREERLGEWGLAEHLMALTVCLWSKQDYAGALPVLERLVVVKEQKKAEDLTDWMGYLGKSLRMVGDNQRAVEVLQKALKLRDKGDQRTGVLLSGLGEAQTWTADYASAAKNLERAVKILETAAGPKHSRTVEATGRLAQLYYSMGDGRRAEELYSRYLKELASGGAHQTLIRQFGELLYSTGYRDAEKTLVQVDGLLATYRREAPTDPTIIALEAMRGILLGQLKRFAESVETLQPLLPKIAQTFGAQSPLQGAVYQSLAYAQIANDQPAEAEKLIRLGLQIQEDSLGSNHPATSWSMLMLAIALQLQGETDGARQMALRQSRADEAVLANVLSFASERQRLAFQPSQYPYLLASLGYGEDCAQIVLRRKGVVLDSIVEDLRLARASQDPRYGQLLSVKKQIAELATTGKKPSSSLERQVERLEGELARSVGGLGRPRKALSVTVEQVQGSLPAGAVLLEFFRFTVVDDKSLTDKDKYGVILFHSSGKPKFVDLGYAEEVDKQIRTAGRAIRRQSGCEKSLSQLHAALWRPVEAGFAEGVESVIISPDSELSTLSFALLLNPEHQFLGEQYQLRYVASGRDLLGQEKATSGRSMLVVANPSFSATSEGVDHRAVASRGFRGMSFPPLPATATEAQALLSLAQGHGWKMELLEGEAATEGALRKRSATILHLATHGFFRGSRDDATKHQGLRGSVYALDRALGDRDGPMYRSGLALAGAQSTLEAWNKGEPQDPENDGVLTAQELGTMDLSETLLVTLSACETGLGQSRPGEGVLGLRRALVQAGARNTLFTLWSVDDEYTAKFMTEFYKQALAGVDPASALISVQRKALTDLRDSVGIDKAAYLAGPFLVSFQGELVTK